MTKLLESKEGFNTVATQLTVRLLPPQVGVEKNPVSHFIASVTNLCEHALQICDDSDMVGVSIRNEVNMRDKAIGISFRRKDQLSTDVILNVWQKVTQSNSRFNALDKLVLEVHSVKMPVAFGGDGRKTKGRSLDASALLKKSIVKVNAERNCLAHALLIAIVKITNDPNCKSYRDGWKIGPVVQRLLETTGINLDRGGGIREFAQFQDYFKEYRIVVSSGLNCEDIMFDGQVQTEKRINLFMMTLHVINM